AKSVLSFELDNDFGVDANPQDEDHIIYEGYPNLERNIPFNGEKALDVYYQKNGTTVKKPVVMFIYGGSWVTGDKIRYTKFGVLLQKSGYVAVLPNYRIYPSGTIEDMVDDVYSAIKWTYNNIEKYGGDPNQIILTAHSAGAHLSALTIVKSTLGLNNNGVPLTPLPFIKKAVLMNGPYILNKDLIGHTIIKGISGGISSGSGNNQSDPSQITLLPKFLLKYYNDNNISPIALLKKAANNSITNQFNIGEFTFFYTSKDGTVPESSAKNLIKEINRTSPSSICNYVYEKGLEHATLIFGIRDGDIYYEN
ncbi:hypothetical protein PIROE2DRAFT_8903, partial [Piromyces sp. E2]